MGNPIPSYIKKCVVKLLKHELFTHFPDNPNYERYDELPEYVANSLRYYALSVNKIVIDWGSLHQQNDNRMDKGYLFTSHIFILQQFKKSFVDLNVLCTLFPNLTKLTVNDINLCRDAMEAISCFVSKNRGSLNRKQIEEKTEKKQ